MFHFNLERNPPCEALEPSVKYSLDSKAECDNLAPTRKKNKTNNAFSAVKLLVSLPPHHHHHHHLPDLIFVSSCTPIFIRKWNRSTRKSLVEDGHSFMNVQFRSCVCKYMYFVENPIGKYRYSVHLRLDSILILQSPNMATTTEQLNN